MARCVLGSVFILASIDKIQYPRDFARIIMAYNVLPNKFAIFIAFTLPWIELCLGVFLIIGIYIRESATILSFLLIGFLIAIAYKALNGGIQSCGCFSLKESNRENVIILIIRDVIFLVCGLSLAFFYKKQPKIRKTI